MQDRRPKLLDVVALLDDIGGTPLKAGHVGTIVEFLGKVGPGGPEGYEVEFCFKDGRTSDFVELERSEFLVLVDMPAVLASQVADQ